MRLFKRAKHVEDGPKCPECGERVLAGARECSMCGHDLEAQHSVAQAPGADSRELGRHWA